MSLREHRLLFRVLPVPASVRPARHKTATSSHLILKPHFSIKIIRKEVILT